VEWDDAAVSVMVQCELLELNRSGVYYQAQASTTRELDIKRRIDEVYTAYPFYGIRRITAQLQADGLLVNHKAVARHRGDCWTGTRALWSAGR